MVSGLAIRLIAIVVAGVFVGGTWLTKGTPELDFLRFFSVAVFVASIILTAWDRWLWKLPLAQKFAQVTRDVSGTWRGNLDSQWVNPDTGLAFGMQDAFLVIRQTSSSASVTLITSGASSKSSIAELINDNGSWSVHYTYMHEPNSANSVTNPMHHGSGVIAVVGNPPRRLRGSYWTDRSSRGDLLFTEQSRRLGDDYQDCTDLFR